RDAQGLAITLEARTQAFGADSVGAPFNLYSYGNTFQSRAYAVRAGDTITDIIPVEPSYHVRVDGPNGFMREFAHDANQGSATPALSIMVDYDDGTSKSGTLRLSLANRAAAEQLVTIRDESYGAPVKIGRAH